LVCLVCLVCVSIQCTSMTRVAYQSHSEWHTSYRKVPGNYTRQHTQITISRISLHFVFPAFLLHVVSSYGRDHSLSPCSLFVPVAPDVPLEILKHVDSISHIYQKVLRRIYRLLPPSLVNYSLLCLLFPSLG
jgi:hypothetical protein